MILSCLFFFGVFDVSSASASCGDYLHAAKSMNSDHAQATAPPLIPRHSPICSGPNCHRRDASGMPTEVVLTPINHEMVLTDVVRLSDHDGLIVSVESPADPLSLSGMRGRVYRPPRIGQF